MSIQCLGFRAWEYKEKKKEGQGVGAFDLGPHQANPHGWEAGNIPSLRDSLPVLYIIMWLLSRHLDSRQGPGHQSS